MKQIIRGAQTTEFWLNAILLLVVGLKSLGVHVPLLDTLQANQQPVAVAVAGICIGIYTLSRTFIKTRPAPVVVPGAMLSQLSAKGP